MSNRAGCRQSSAARRRSPVPFLSPFLDSVQSLAIDRERPRGSRLPSVSSHPCATGMDLRAKQRGIAKQPLQFLLQRSFRCRVEVIGGIAANLR